MMEVLQEQSLDELIKELYQLKSILRNYPRTHYTSKGELKRRALVDRKIAVILLLQEALRQVSKQKAGRIRNRLWKDLGLVI